MELNALKTFIAVADERNIARAAARLHLTPSPVSRSIRQLEHRIGTPLFLRNHHDLQLTPAGKILLSTALQISDELALAESKIRNLMDAGDRWPNITIGATQRVNPEIIDDVIERISTASPTSTVSVSTGESSKLLLNLKNGTLDLAIVHLPVNDSSICTANIAEYACGAAMRADDPLASLDVLTPGDVRGRSIIFPPAGVQPLAMAELRRALLDFGFAAADDSAPSDPVLASNLVLRDTSRPLALTGNHTPGGRVFADQKFRVVPFTGNAITLRVGLAWSSPVRAPWVTAMIDAVVDAAGVATIQAG
ncbi:LysR family transcriptional regulator [Nocardia sp. 348MFTsu5.1]|uniref:LysR family transcriptional regulator n=1 Tax=Nocardia sp. 348MFTsu5.1 TaxID=1172185 RepID=UPI0003671937|nr:LysR family transcriptional regulator [Nocardia sp. 348MFTsu5.1]